MDTVKDVLASIKKTAALKDKILKEIGISAESSEIISDNIYQFLYKSESEESYQPRNFILLHGKCIESGKKALGKFNYNFLKVKSIDKNNDELCRTRCSHCKKQLDPKKALALISNRKKERDRIVAEYNELQAYKLEWEAEQVLLGKL